MEMGEYNELQLHLTSELHYLFSQSMHMMRMEFHSKHFCCNNGHTGVRGIR